MLPGTRNHNHHFWNRKIARTSDATNKMMKYLPFVALCILAFHPIQVEGFFLNRIGNLLIQISFFFDNFSDNILYSNRRNKRDCEALYASAGITNTESCFCDGSSSLSIFCDSLKEETCITTTGATYCSTNSNYFGFSTEREPFSSATPKLQSEYPGFLLNDDVIEGFAFGFTRDVESETKKYVVEQCFAGIEVADEDFGSFFYFCDSCEVCENGLDFSFNCIDYLVNATCVPISSVFSS